MIKLDFEDLPPYEGIGESPDEFDDYQREAWDRLRAATDELRRTLPSDRYLAIEACWEWAGYWRVQDNIVKEPFHFGYKLTPFKRPDGTTSLRKTWTRDENQFVACMEELTADLIAKLNPFRVVGLVAIDRVPPE